jgi:hypothetical protein
MKSRRESTRAPWPVFSLLWVAGTLSLLVGPVGAWVSAGPRLRIPATPVDLVNSVYARQWLLVQKARDFIPAGESYTAIAGDKDEEMLLFMLSFGVLFDREALPTSLWKVPFVGAGDRARYVISFGGERPAGPARLVRRFADGCVWERSGALP